MTNDAMFRRVALCLEELAIQNEALWTLVHKTIPTHRWPPPELFEARKKFEAVGIRASLDSTQLQDRLDKLLAQIGRRGEEIKDHGLTGD
jgi:hypothetical protein